MEFSPAQESDLAEVFKLASASLKGHHSQKFFRKHLSSFFVVAREKGKLQGFVIARNRRLVLIAVSEGARRKGLGSRLVEMALQEFGELRLKVRESNLGAIEFYKSTGWKLEGRQENGYRDGEAALEFCKRLPI